MRDLTTKTASENLDGRTKPSPKGFAETSESDEMPRSSRPAHAKSDGADALGRGKKALISSKYIQETSTSATRQSVVVDRASHEAWQEPNHLRPPSYTQNSPSQLDATISEQLKGRVADSLPLAKLSSSPSMQHKIEQQIDSKNDAATETAGHVGIHEERRGEIQETLKDENDLESDIWPDINEESFLDAYTRTDKTLSAFEPLALETETALDEIHILGMGVVGKFIAHSLAGTPMPPKITLLMQTPLSIQEWHDEGESITLYKQGRLHTHRGFNVESAAVQDRTHPKQWAAVFGNRFQTPVETPMTPINTLIVTTPAKITVPAILAIRERLRPTSAICLVHDGLGVMEDLNTIVFPNSDQRPTYILGNLTGSTNLVARSERRYMVEQKGDVTLTCSKQPQRAISIIENDITVTRTDHSWKQTASFLVGCLTRTPEFHTVPVAHKTYMQKQLYSVLAHAVIGPISVLYDCTYLELLQSHHARLAMRGLIEELLMVVYAFPELQTLRNNSKNLSPKGLEVIIRRILGNKPDGVSTMLQNTRAGKRTDIDYYNGYLLLRAAELGVECPRNQMLIDVVKGKQNIVSRQRGRTIPLVEE